MKKGGSLRIIAGKFRGRRVKTIDGPGTRPMTDRVRESFFNIISPYLPGARFLDCFAGSGAVGFEAISRGAEHATFVEMASNWHKLIGENAQTLDVSDSCNILKADAYKAIRNLHDAGEVFDVAFIGSPYDENHHNRMLQTLVNYPVHNDESLIILQYRKGDPLDEIAEKFEVEIRNYGITSLTFLRAK